MLFYSSFYCVSHHYVNHNFTCHNYGTDIDNNGQYKIAGLPMRLRWSRRNKSEINSPTMADEPFSASRTFLWFKNSMILWFRTFRTRHGAHNCFCPHIKYQRSSNNWPKKFLAYHIPAIAWRFYLVRYLYESVRMKMNYENVGNKRATWEKFQ